MRSQASLPRRSISIVKTVFKVSKGEKSTGFAITTNDHYSE